MTLSRETPLKIARCKKRQQNARIPKGNAGKFLCPSFGRPSPCIFRGTFCAAIRARLPENLQVQENKAVMRDVPQNYKLQDVASCKKSRQAKCTDTQRKRAKVSAPVVRQTFPCIHHVLCCTTGTSGVRYFSKLISCAVFLKKWKL